MLLAPPGVCWHTFDTLPSYNGRLSGKNYWLPTDGERSSRVAARLTLFEWARGWLSRRLQLPGSHQPWLAVPVPDLYSSLATSLYCDMSSILLKAQVVKKIIGDSVPCSCHKSITHQKGAFCYAKRVDNWGCIWYNLAIQTQRFGTILKVTR